MIKQSKNCSNVMKKHFNNKGEMTKRDDEDFENSTKCWVSDDGCVDGEAKVPDHFQITKTYPANIPLVENVVVFAFRIHLQANFKTFSSRRLNSTCSYVF